MSIIYIMWVYKILYSVVLNGYTIYVSSHIYMQVIYFAKVRTKIHISRTFKNYISYVLSVTVEDINSCVYGNSTWFKGSKTCRKSK